LGNPILVERRLPSLWGGMNNKIRICFKRRRRTEFNKQKIMIIIFLIICWVRSLIYPVRICPENLYKVSDKKIISRDIKYFHFPDKFGPRKVGSPFFLYSYKEEQRTIYIEEKI
jgi:hypothetical protein